MNGFRMTSSSYARRSARRFTAKAVFLLLTAALLMFGFVTAASAGTDTNYSGVNPDVSKKARKKYTKLKGKGKDDVTIMIYMIGTDLESQNGMATSDLNEMLYSGLNNNRVSLYVQTGGCKRWRNSVISAGKTQRWSLTGEGLELRETMKAQTMTSPSVLSDFIQYCAEESPADRYILIFWDHGGGSVSGYGYDETYPNDSMDIAEISRALKYGGVKFDIVGFDACLMSTLETAIAVEPFADYMIASEEAEPGTGWYYTNWLKLLDSNSSTNTLNLGRQIIDDFTTASAQMSYSYQTTLSLVDLAELKGTVIKKLGDFGNELNTQLKGKNYQDVAIARNGTREFASSQRLDQVDLVDFCNRLGTKQASALAEAVVDAVKYNKVNRITDAYGLSAYFPNSSLKSINSMLNLYNSIGMNTNWSESIKTYATLESSGQIVASSGNSYGSGSGSLFDILLGGNTSSSQTGSFGGSSSSSSSTGLFGDSSSSSGGGFFNSLFGGSEYDTSDTYGSYDSYSSMSVEDIYNLLTGSSSYGYDAYGSSGSGSGYGSSGSSYGSGYGTSGSTSSYGSEDLLSTLFGQMMGGYTTTDGSSYGGLDMSSLLGGYDMSSYGSSSYNSTSSSEGSGDLLSLAAELLFGREMVGSETLKLTEKDGQQVLVLPEERWEQVVAADLNVFIDDGEGYLDLGLDNVAEYNDDGDLIDAWDGTWLTLEGQPAAIFPISDEDEDDDGLYITRKFIPALLNGERVNLIIEFNEETGEDTVLGAQNVNENGVVGRGYTEMNGGDEIVLVCDYYNYNGEFSSQYTLGDPITVPEDGVLTIVNMKLTADENSRMLYTYRLTDIYQAHYWLPVTESEI